jgi:CGNR zinc finger
MKAIAEADQPVGPPMKPREGIEFLVTVASLDFSKLATAGRPENIADLGHVAGVFYELCRFSQAARAYYDKWLGAVCKDRARLEEGLKPLRDLMAAIADGTNFSMALQPDTRIGVFGRQWHRDTFRSPLPFVIQSPSHGQALVVTAIFYLGLARASCLIRRCKEAKCGKLFMAVRHSRRFCSHECASAASVRAFRQRQKVQEA